MSIDNTSKGVICEIWADADLPPTDDDQREIILDANSTLCVRSYQSPSVNQESSHVAQ